MAITKSTEVHLFVAVAECGCVRQAVLPNRVAGMMSDSFFGPAMAAGRVRSVSSDEYKTLPWTCDVCQRFPVEKT